MPDFSFAVVTVVASIRPQPDEARSWLERELSRPEYHQSLVDRFLSWLGDLWDRLTQGALEASPLSTAAAALVLAVLAVLVTLVLSRVRREPSRAGTGGSARIGSELSPDDHRSAARSALADGAADLALVEAFRALAARAVQRGLVEERPGLTAHELASDLRPVFPDHADDLDHASALFDLVFYGDLPATAADAQRVLDLDDLLRRARPDRPHESEPAPAAAVPR
jgi:hypothetical protein